MTARGSAGSNPPRGGVIRRAGKRDFEEVVRLWSDLAHHHVPMDPVFALRAGAEAEIRALLAAQLRDPDSATFVWESHESSAPSSASETGRAGRLAGLCIVRVDRAPPIQSEVERAEVTDLIVEKASRRRGIGGALLDAALAWVSDSGVERVEVRVAVRNVEGQAFWRARAFSDWMDVLQLRL